MFVQNSKLQTCPLQNAFVSTPNSLCLNFQIFDQLFFADAPPVKTKQYQEVNFSIIYLLRTVCELTSSIIQTHYTQKTLILFTSVKVILDRRLQNTFSKNNTLCVLLSLMPTHPFLNSCCLVGVCFLGFMPSSSFSLVSCSYLSPTASNSNPPL